jgi:hypothetical protein
LVGIVVLAASGWVETSDGMAPAIPRLAGSDLRAAEQRLLARALHWAAREVVQFPLDLLQRRELEVLGSEADIGDPVHMAEFGHDPLTDGVAGDLALELGVEFFLNQFGELSLDVLGDRRPF